MLSLAGKRGVVFGFASAKSIAWGVADAWQHAGMESLSICIQNERFRPALEKLTSNWKTKPHIVICDASSDSSLDQAFSAIADFHKGRTLDAVVHSIAFATSHGMKSPLLETTREDFRVAHDISAYTLVAIARGLAPIMTSTSSTNSSSSGAIAAPAPSTTPSSNSSSLISLSYIGSQRAVPNYKVMGAAKASLESISRYLAVDLGPRNIRVNVISAGPIDTLAARGIPGFTDMKEQSNAKTPLKRGIVLEDVGGMATFLASDASRGVTGQTLYVDCGFSAVV
jgi:enoyl-[acyl-carrier protein] reductase I